MVAFIFPGQGSQAAGMGKTVAEAYPSARQTFEEADDALGMALSKICFEGPVDELKKTEITQPAILTTSVAVLRALQSERPTLVPQVAAGHSLGEWTALVAVGALRFRDAVKLVRERGRLMQEAVPLGEGAMSAVLGMAPEKVAEIVARVQTEDPAEIVCVANYNSADQNVISGAKRGVERAAKALTDGGATKVLPLPVSAPFHSPLMAPAAKGLEPFLTSIEIGPMSAPVISNVEAKANRDPVRVKKLLLDQVTAPVRWVETIKLMAEMGVAQAIEIGPGKVLAGLVRRIDRNVKVINIEDAASLKKALEALPA
jgi:[acyl-carrier-protein] S-malonyltransferase